MRRRCASGNAEARQAVLQGRLQPLRDVWMGARPALDDLALQFACPLEGWAVEDGADVLGDRPLVFPADLYQGVPGHVHLAALRADALEVLPDGVHRAPVIVAGHQLHAA